MNAERRFNQGQEVRAIGDPAGPERSIAGYAATYNKYSSDLGGFRERLTPGCFKRVLESRADTACLLNHDPNFVLGRTAAGTLHLTDGPIGLVYECNLPDTQVGRDLWTSVKRGDIRGNSFAFVVNRLDTEWDEDVDDETGERFARRTIHNITKLIDVSPVTFPAYPSTNGLLNARSMVEIPEGCPVEMRSLIVNQRNKIAEAQERVQRRRHLTNSVL